MQFDADEDGSPFLDSSLPSQVAGDATSKTAGASQTTPDTGDDVGRTSAEMGASTATTASSTLGGEARESLDNATSMRTNDDDEEEEGIAGNDGSASISSAAPVSPPAATNETDDQSSNIPEARAAAITTAENEGA